MRRKPQKGLESEVQRQRRSRIRTRLVATFSFLLCIASLILDFLCSFSGLESSYLGNRPVVSINTTLLGYDLLSSHSFNTGAEPQSTELGIQQWYSLNVLSVCEGSYEPSAFVSGAKFEVNSCISRTPMDHFNLTAHLEQEIRKGPSNATLSDLDWPTDIQKDLNSVNGYLEAAFILYIFSTIFILSTMIPSAIMVFLTSTYSFLSPKMCLLSAINFCLELSAVATGTIYSHKSASAINSLGRPIGVSAAQGHQFLVMCFTNVGLTALLALLWVIETYVKIREDRRARMTLHQEHYERARMWGKIGPLEGEEPVCSRVDPWKVMGHRKGGGDCGDKGMPNKIDTRQERGGLEAEDTWVAVEEKVLVLGR